MGTRGVWRRTKDIERDESHDHVLKITMEGLRPPIWRRIRIGSDATFEHLHHVIQTAFGWTNSHLHQFLTESRIIGIADDEDADPRPENEKVTFLGDVLTKPGDSIRYEYDFGDGWSHWVETESHMARIPRASWVECTDGARACPPEDCGGESGYEDLLRALKNPKTDDDREMVEWAGDYDPEEFSAKDVNRALARMFAPAPKKPKARRKVTKTV